jgi:hypothetical protein
MKYFLPDGSYRYGFRFRQKYPNTQPWISLGMVGKYHLGDDMICNGVQGIATLEGTGKYVWGTGAGHQLHFYPKGRNHLIRFLHLKSKETTKTGTIKPGDKVFITNNSGTQTTIAHEHCDIWNLDYGPLNINNISGFLNPSTYDWGQAEPLPSKGKEMIVQKQGEGILYLLGEGKLFPIAADYPTYQAQFGSTPVAVLPASEFAKYPVSTLKLKL